MHSPPPPLITLLTTLLLILSFFPTGSTALSLSLPLSLPQSPFLPSLPFLSPTTAPICNCTGTNKTSNPPHTPSPYICHDTRLGPKLLPRRFPLLSFVSDYDRFGGLTPGQFLEKWTDAKTGAFVYPPKNGFQLDLGGGAILGNMTLGVGARVDRFGSEYGSYVAAADAPYSQRSLPPSNLDTPVDAPDYPYNYHVYDVLKPFNVVGGPVAPWFGQPGLGAQFYVGDTGNILKLLDLGYIERVNKSKIEPGPGRGNRGCGL